jgi:isocitrate/isopropylmalate dehydrogenase
MVSKMYTAEDRIKRQHAALNKLRAMSGSVWSESIDWILIAIAESGEELHEYDLQRIEKFDCMLDSSVTEKKDEHRTHTFD